MKKGKLIDAIWVTVVYATGLYYGYKIGNCKGQAKAYSDCAEMIEEVITSTQHRTAEVDIQNKEE